MKNFFRGTPSLIQLQFKYFLNIYECTIYHNIYYLS